MSDITVEIEGVGQLVFPEGTPMSVIQQKVNELTAPQVPPIPMGGDSAGRGFLDYTMEQAPQNLAGQLEMAGTIASGAIADPLAKIVDIASTPFVGVEQGTQYGQNVRQAMTYQPRTERGQQFARSTGEVLEPVGEAFKSMGQAIKGGVQTATGSEVAGEMTKDILSFLPDLFAGYFAVKGVMPVRLKNPDGSPTPEFNLVLAEAGMSASELSPSTLAALPDVYNPLTQPSLKARVQRSELEAGTGQGGTAAIQTKGSGLGIKTDPLGKQAVDMGWEPRTVAMIKTATPETRALMLEQIDLYRAYKANERSMKRPWQPVGRALEERLVFLQDQMTAANTTKNKIARDNFAGLRVDTMPVATELTEMFSQMGIKFERGADGKLKGKYEDTDIEFSPSAQRQIDVAADLMFRQPPPDAARLHRMKLQIDNLIDEVKLDKGGISAKGEEVLLTLRSGINDALRQASPEYASLNDFLHQSISIMDDIQKGIGTTVKLSGPSAARDLGRQSRRLESNTIAQGFLADGTIALQNLTDE